MSDGLSLRLMASDDALDRLLHQVQHWVPAHCGSKRRLSVAFNAAVLLPDRRWPDGALSRALPNLEVTLATARADLEQRRRTRRRGAAADDGDAHDDVSYLHELWPLQVTRAHAAPSAAIDDALRAATCSRRPTSAKVTVSAATSAVEVPNGLGTCAASALAAGPTPFVPAVVDEGGHHRQLEAIRRVPRGGPTPFVPRCCYLALSPPPVRQDAALADAFKQSGKVGGAVSGAVGGAVGGESGAACSERCSEVALQPLLAPIGAAVRAHLLESPHGDLDAWPPVEGARVVAGRRVVTGVRVLLEALAADHEDWLPKGKDTVRWPVGEQRRREQRRTRPLANGVFFLPSAVRSSVPPEAADAPETSVANCSSSRSLIVPDWRTGAAGDLQAHLELREPLGQGDTGGLAAPDGTLFVYPPTARSFVFQRARCIATLAGGRPSRLAALAFRVLLDE